jgi:hypothetical protein
LAKTHLQHVATAAAIDLERLAAWFRALPRAATRTSRFVALAAARADFAAGVQISASRDDPGRIGSVQQDERFGQRMAAASKSSSLPGL